MFGGRLKDLLKKYGKVGIGVHVSVSAASIAGLYVAINNNVDVESALERLGMPNLLSSSSKKKCESSSSSSSDLPLDRSSDFENDRTVENNRKERNRTAELAKTSGGALAVAFLINKALFPVRVPITLALTPPVARFLARRNLIKTG